MNKLEKAQANRAYVRRLLSETLSEFARTLESAVATFPGKPEEAHRMRAGRGRELDVARGGCGAALAAPRFAQHNPQEATATLALVRDGSVSGIHLAPVVAALLLEAIADDEPGDSDAGRVPERAPGTAGPDRVLFLALIRLAPELLDRHAQHGPADAALICEAADLLGEVGRPTSPSREPARPGEPLTRSEIRVLRYLPTHLSAREIASELYLSANTVKTHLRHLYRKLGAHSRHEAVQRARAIGLLKASSRRMLRPPAEAAPVQAGLWASLSGEAPVSPREKITRALVCPG